MIKVIWNNNGTQQVDEFQNADSTFLTHANGLSVGVREKYTYKKEHVKMGFFSDTEWETEEEGDRFNAMAEYAPGVWQKWERS